MHNDKVVNILLQRSSGILLPIFSLPGPYGIGDLGLPAHQFIEFLQKGGQGCWQILPLGPTSPLFGNSPYMSYSSFAGDPLFISPDLLKEAGLLRKSDIILPELSEYAVDYNKAASLKKALLALAWKNFQRQGLTAKLNDFRKINPWAEDHALFLALKNRFHQRAWTQWPEPIRRRDDQALSQAAEELADQIDYFTFEQYLFKEQWQVLRAHARKHGIRIIGDLPIYVAHDSVDVWSNQEIFHLDPESSESTEVAGVPPDYFSATGQRWGNPLYHWNTKNTAVKDQLWNWWEQRLRRNFFHVDTLRIDHFRGFESYWAIPATEETAINGRWKKGPGKPFFKEMNRRLGGMSIIAEDLGLITPAVENLRKGLGYPGMKILLFAFDGNADNSYLPYNCDKDSVIYTGTHDNDTAVGWYLSPEVDPASKQRAKLFAGRDDDHAGTFHEDIIHLALSSPPNLAILPMQDVLGFGNDCRINTPGTTDNNWKWRCASRFINDEIAIRLRRRTELFGRIPRQENNKK